MCAASACPSARATSPATPDEGRVEDGGVLPLEQADRADLVAERDGHLAELALDDLRGEQLVPRRDRREDAGDRDPVAAPGDRAEERGDRVVVERRQVPAVELDPAGHDGRARRDHGGEVGWPFEHRPDAERGRGADPDHRDAMQLAALQHRVGRVRGPEHRVRDPCAAVAVSEVPITASSAATMPPVTSGVVGTLALASTRSVAVEDHGVGVGPADVDAESVVKRWHRRAPPRARSRSRSRTRAARPSPARTGSARSGRNAIAITVTRWPYRTRSVGIASAVSLSRTVIRSGTEASTLPCSSATRFSF